MEPSFATPVDPPADAARPLVARPVTNRGVWVFAGLMLIAAIGLFSTLESRRSAITSPATMYNPAQSPNTITAPPALVVPQDGGAYAGSYYGPTVIPGAAPLPMAVPYTLPGVPRTPRVSQPGSIPGPPIARQPPYFDPASPDAAYRQPQPPLAAPVAPAEDTSTVTRPAGGRVLATRLANPAVTVQQGTVIHAVLETALDSNRPGFVRAIVSRDVRSFDGTRVLIPRGSRLFGEYKSDLGQGQRRVLVQWQKLTRPDGVQIALDSPAADPLGRAGIGGKVNTHFFARFASALLQSTLDIGVGLATRSAGGGTVVLGLPGSTQNLVQPNQDNLRPTVTVKQGTSVSVFVAHDLDFSTVE